MIVWQGKRVIMGGMVHLRGKGEQKMVHTWWPRWDSSPRFFHSQPPGGKGVRFPLDKLRNSTPVFLGLPGRLPRNSSAGIYPGH